MKVLVRKNGQFFREVDFSGKDLVLGRSVEADIQLLHEDISRKHVKISQKSGQLILEDLGSKNGTVHRGKLTTKTVLQEGEVFSIGPFTISIESIAPQQQRTVVEHSLDPEAPTGDFHENTGATNTSRGIRPDDFPSAEDQPEQKQDSDSFLSAIAVSKKEEQDDDEEYHVVGTENNDDPQVIISTDPKMDEVIEYSKPTDPYRSIPEYLQEAKERKKNESKGKKTNEPSSTDENEEPDDGRYETQPTRPYTDLPEYLKQNQKKEKKNKAKHAQEENPKTTPFEKLDDREEGLEDDEESQSNVKTQVRPESTMERSLKDFPSISNDSSSEVPESEQFFLNREIDEEGIKQTFEDFPDTNKVRVAKDMESSFSMASEGEIESEDEHHPTEPVIREIDPVEHPSNSIPTESFSSAETEVSDLDEDQIKTFMFHTNDLPDDLQSEKTDEFHQHKDSAVKRLLLKLKTVKPYVQSAFKDPKKRKVILGANALLLGLMIYFVMEGANRPPVDPEIAINSEEGFQKLRKSERKRVVAFQIDKIQKLITNKQLEEADARMKKLMTLAVNDQDFVKYEKEYQLQRDAILEEEHKKQQEAQEKKKKRDDAIIEAQKMVDNKQYDLAKKTYMRVLETSPDDLEVQEKIQTLELLQEQDERKSFAKKQRYDMLNRIYTEGVQKYESGQLGQAQKLFKQVTTERGHPKYKKANDYLSRISSNTDKKMNQRIASAKSMIQNPDTLLAGYQELKKIVSQFPLRSDAKKLFSDAKVRMDKKARELYADALAQEELAGDPAAALDLYREVLKYAPDKSSRYNQKAQEKINSLQL